MQSENGENTHSHFDFFHPPKELPSGELRHRLSLEDVCSMDTRNVLESFLPSLDIPTRTGNGGGRENGIHEPSNTCDPELSKEFGWLLLRNLSWFINGEIGKLMLSLCSITMPLKQNSSHYGFIRRFQVETQRCRNIKETRDVALEVLGEKKGAGKS
ncbi:hypothetical protein ACO22_04914 [Paracoccidioides brasiliensis]|uniref:Uncharacterized protein n=1 Tax=Paracoccidioides brasiliensis TaxID=121759 RepID=A0A1D2JBT5_PARBR|nr:hypothetical protein ACO22_04914 [Paracoccidioides brasiliensis]